MPAAEQQHADVATPEARYHRRQLALSLRQTVEQDPFAVAVPNILRAAQQAIAAPERWIQGETSVDRNGDFIPPHDSRVAKLCMIGALDFGYHKSRTLAGLPWVPDPAYLGPVGRRDPAYELAEAYLAIACDGDIAAYNDDPNRDHDDVMEAFRNAITDAENDDPNWDTR